MTMFWAYDNVLTRQKTSVDSGIWDTTGATNYVSGDAVFYAGNSTEYYCLIANNSTTTPDVNTTDWTPNLDIAVITLDGSTPEDPSFPLTNLYEQTQTIKEFKTLPSSGGVAIIYVDAGSAVAADSFCICGNNVSRELGVTSVQIQGNTTNSWGSPPFTSGSFTRSTTPGINMSEVFGYQPLGSTQTYRYWKITLTNANDNVVSVAKMFLGPAVVLGQGAFDFGWTFARVDQSVTNFGRYHEAFTTRLNQWKVITGQFLFLNPAEAAALQACYRYCGVGQAAVWVMVEPTGVIMPGNAELFGGYYYFASASGTSGSGPDLTYTNYSLWSSSVELDEVV